MIKKITAVILLIGLFLTAIPACAANFVISEDYSERIDATDFSFEFKRSNGNSANRPYSGGTVSASCMVKRTDVGEGSQSCTLVLMVYEKNKLIACKTGTAVAPATKEPVALTVSEPATFPTPSSFDADDYKVYAYIWTDFLQPKILTRPAEFKGSVNTLNKLFVNGSSVDLEDFEEIEDKEHKFTYVFDKIPNQLPKITAKADDLGAKIQITDAVAVPGSGEVRVTPPSNRAADRRYYTVDFTVQSKKKVVDGAITGDTCSRTSYESPTSAYMYTNIYNGAELLKGFDASLRRAFIQIDVTKFPDEAALIEDITLKVAAFCRHTNQLSATPPETMTVNIYNYPQSEFDWAETDIKDEQGTVIKPGIDANSSSVGPLIKNIIQKTPITSLTVECPDASATTGAWNEYSFSIKDQIIAAKENNEEYITLIFFADNSERQYLPAKDENGNDQRDQFSFVMGTKENTTDTYIKGDETLSVQPQVILEYYEREE